MSLNYLNPLTEIRDQIDRIFTDFTEEPRFPSLSRMLENAPARTGAWLPPIEMTENDTDVLLKVALPGLKADDIHVEVVGNTLVLSGEYRRESKRDEKHVHRSEFHYGHFRRTVPLPEYVRGEATAADFKDGVLALRVPKVEESKRKRIEVRQSGK
jgi:HSP20 family protein